MASGVLRLAKQLACARSSTARVKAKTVQVESKRQDVTSGNHTSIFSSYVCAICLATESWQLQPQPLPLPEPQQHE